MIDSVTIFSKTGLILYHYSHLNSGNANDNANANDKPNTLTSAQTNAINQFISQHLTSPSEKNYNIPTTPESIAEYESSDSNVNVSDDSDDMMVVILYPKVISQHADMSWTGYYMSELLKEYCVFSNRTSNSEDEKKDDASREAGNQLFNATNVALYEKSQIVGKHTKSTSAKNKNTTTTTKASKAGKKGKEGRVWHDGGEQEVTSKTMAKLDRSKNANASTGNMEDAMDIPDSSPALMEARAAYLPTADEVPSWQEEERLDDNAEEGDDSDGSGSGSGSSSTSTGWGSSLKGMMDQVSGKVLTSSDLDGPLQEMEKILTGKNVARDIAQEICQKVREKMVGKKMASFTRVKTAVRQALEGAIEKILKPGKGRGGSDDVDILRDVVTKRERGMGMGAMMFGAKKQAGKKPYVIVMVGINGVGKSTSLAKIAYYLKSNGCNPLLAACDTFRSGAVEQLNVHAKCLKVPLYHKGYAKDPAAVAKSAIDHASHEGNDVVLVDTAGRMQNNVPLMKALSNLVVQNNPDLVLFVCEALVGNDGMDQLDMFNKALMSGGHGRKIDGIVLTKFDTVSDKVGAALTMTHVTGAPVVFCGTGQKYNHLKKLSVQSVIKSLFS